MKHLILFIISIFFLAQSINAEESGDLLWKHDLKESVWGFEFSPTDPNILAVIASYTENTEWSSLLFIFDVKTGDTLKIIEFEKDHLVFSLDFSNDGSQIVFGTKNNDILVYDILNDELNNVLHLGDFPWGNNGVLDLKFTHDGKYLMASCRYLFTINTEDWTVKQKWNEIYHDDSPPPGSKDLSTPRELSVSYDNKYVSCVFSPNDIVIIYDIENNENIKMFGCYAYAKFFNKSNKLMVQQESCFLEYDLTNEEQRKLKPSNFNMLISDNDEFLYKIGSKSTQIVRISDNEEIGRIIAKNFDDYLAAVKNDKYFVTKLLEMYDISGLTSVTHEKENSVEISPNPAKDEIRIIGLPLYIRTIEIADLKGNIVGRIDAKTTNGELTHNVSHLPAGAYLLRISTRDDSQSVKFMIER